MDGCLILTGTPGAGKTTVSQLVAERLPRSARLDGDVMASRMVSGAVSPMGADGRWDPGPEAREQLRLRMTNLCSLADNFATAGYTPVVDTVVETHDELELIAGMLSTRPLLLVVLAPPLAVARHRNETRDPVARVDYDFAHTGENMRRELAERGWCFDTADLTPDETADRIVEKAAETAVVDF